jgi:hypothetical protein
VTSNTFRTSTNGTSWSTLTTGTKCAEALTKLGTAIAPLSMPVRWASVNNRLYYPGNDYTATGASATPSTIYTFDGTTAYLLAQIPIHTSFNYGADFHGVVDIIPYSPTEMLVTTYDGNGATGRGRVMLLTVTTGQLTQLGPQTAVAGAPLALTVFQGKIYFGTFSTNLTVSTIYWCRPGDATLTADALAMPAGEFPISMCVFKGDLYMGTSAAWPVANPISSHIKKLSASSRAWTNAQTNTGTGTANFIGPLILSSDSGTMYNMFYDAAAVSPVIKIQSTTDGASWSTAYDIALNVGSGYFNSGTPVLDSNGDIYWPVFDSNQKMRLLRLASGVWSIVDSTANQYIRGPILWLRHS